MWFDSVYKIWLKTRRHGACPVPGSTLHNLNDSNDSPTSPLSPPGLVRSPPNPFSNCTASQSPLFHLQTPSATPTVTPTVTETVSLRPEPYQNEPEQELFAFLTDHNLSMLFDRLRALQLFVDELSNVDVHRDEFDSLCGADALDIRSIAIRIRLKTALRTLSEERHRVDIAAANPNDHLSR